MEESYFMKSDNFDHGKEFNWGKTSEYYAKYRDIYPPEFYNKLLQYGLCLRGQNVLDLGTGTGVLPRNMFQYGASFVGVDISKQQIEKARELSQKENIDINYIVSPAENVHFPDNTFDVVTACQCFMYFDKSILLPNLHRMLKPGGKLAILFLSWLPDESEIAQQSENLILKYNPSWTGAHYKKLQAEKAGKVEEPAPELFKTEHKISFDINIPFTRETWNGRIKSCRGIGASLPKERVEAFSREHLLLLEKAVPETFEIPHNIVMIILNSVKQH